MPIFKALSIPGLTRRPELLARLQVGRRKRARLADLARHAYRSEDLPARLPY